MPLLEVAFFLSGISMRDFPFSFEQLNCFSKDLPYGFKSSDEIKVLYQKLKENEKTLNFPAIRDDIGKFINFLFHWQKPEKIFEFGSGYGQSAFWYLLNNQDIQEIVLTEKRDDLETVFESLPWPATWKNKIVYHQADAFDVFKNIDKVDFVLIDGVKSDYLEFLKECESKLSDSGMVLIDNSYWRGSFLDPEVSEKKQTAKNIKALHQYIKDSSKWEAVFVPFEDGVTLLRKTI